MIRLHHRVATTVRAGIVALAMGGAIGASPGIAHADATDEYPIPNRILTTRCTAEQIMAAARDVEPFYYERYMIDYNNKAPDVQQAVQDRIHWFFAMDSAARRQYSEDTATNAFYEQLASNWPNWAKLFFNNTGVAVHTTDICTHDQPNDAPPP